MTGHMYNSFPRNITISIQHTSLGAFAVRCHNVHHLSDRLKEELNIYKKKKKKSFQGNKKIVYAPPDVTPLIEMIKKTTYMIVLKPAFELPLFPGMVLLMRVSIPYLGSTIAQQFTNHSCHGVEVKVLVFSNTQQLHECHYQT